MADVETGVLAGVGRRAAALLIDVFLVYLVVLIVAGITGNTKGYSPLGFQFGLVGDLLILAGGLLYFVVLEAEVGMTVGKAAAGLRVVKADGGRVGYRASVVRNLLRFVDALPYVPPYLLAVVGVWNTDQNQRRGDLAAGTVVLERKPNTTFVPVGPS